MELDPDLVRDDRLVCLESRWTFRVSSRTILGVLWWSEATPQISVVPGARLRLDPGHPSTLDLLNRLLWIVPSKMISIVDDSDDF